MDNSTERPVVLPDDYKSCYYNPRGGCISSLNLSGKMQDHLWSSPNREFDCLYDSYLDMATVFAQHNITEEKAIADSLNRICFPEVDEATCWNATYSGFNETAQCPDIPQIFTPGATITRTCSDGVWGSLNYKDCLSEEGYELLSRECLSGHSTNYSAVCELVTAGHDSSLEERLSVIQRDIYFFGSAASLMLLTIALVIFCVFKALQCPRVHIHKNLVISLMIQCIVNIVIFEPYVQLESGSASATNAAALRTTYIEHTWLCKILFTLSNYATLTNLFWGFVEGLFLISRISIAVFSNSTPYWLFYSIGWGIPAIFAIAWALCMHYYHYEQDCWRNFTQTPYFMLILVPTVTVAVINAIFLIGIIRILITKLHAVNIDDHVQARKAMKAAVVLLPLLSITGLLFVWAPNLEKTPKAHYAYRITNASLHVAQGILVSVIFCFFNGEVRSALLNHWKQWRSESFRYRSSRASSVCVTQSEHLAPLASNQLRKMSYSSHISTGVEMGGTSV